MTNPLSTLISFFFVRTAKPFLAKLKWTTNWSLSPQGLIWKNSSRSLNLFVGMTFPFSVLISSISASPISSFFWSSKRLIEYTVTDGMLSRAFPGFQRYGAAKAGSLQESRPAKEEDRRKSRSCDVERRAQLSKLLECSNLANFRLPHVSAS
jgi:hypothetical protein